MRPPAPAGRPAALAVVLLVAGLLATACAAGPPPHYTEPQGSGATASTGAIVVSNTQIAFAGSIEAAAVYRAGQSAELTGTIVNTGNTPDRLVGASSPVASGTQITGTTELAPQTELAIGPQPGASLPSTSPVQVVLTGLRTDVRSGLTYPVTFRFATAGAVTLPVPVAQPDVPASGCPLPPNGKLPELLPAPVGAPVPPTPPPPVCPTLPG